MDNLHVFRSPQSYHYCEPITPAPLQRKRSMKRGFPLSCAATITRTPAVSTDKPGFVRASSHKQLSTPGLQSTHAPIVTRSRSWNCSTTLHSVVPLQAPPEPPRPKAALWFRARDKHAAVHCPAHIERRSLYLWDRAIQKYTQTRDSDKVGMATGAVKTVSEDVVVCENECSEALLHSSNDTPHSYRQRFWAFLFSKKK